MDFQIQIKEKLKEKIGGEKNELLQKLLDLVDKNSLKELFSKKIHKEVFDIVQNDNQIFSFFYDALGEYIVKNEYEEWGEIFMVIRFMNTDLHYDIILSLSKKKEENPRLKNFIEYELLLYYYLVFNDFEEKYKPSNHEDNILDIEFNDKIQQYYHLIHRLWKEKIVLNELFHEKKNKCVTLFDLFVHSSYLVDSKITSIIVLDILLEELKNMDDTTYFDFHQTYVNTENLGILSTQVSNKNRDLIYGINQDIEKGYMFVGKFQSFLNKSYHYFTKDKKGKLLILLNEKTYPEYIDYYYQEIYEKRGYDIFIFSDKFNPDESVDMIRGALYMDNPIFFQFLMNFIEKTNGIIKVFMIIIWFRYIYKKLNIRDKSIIYFDVKKNQYQINIKGKYIQLDRDVYLDDIVIYLKKIDSKMRDFLLKEMDYFVNNYIHQLKEIEECKEQEEECCICLDKMKKEDIKSVCIECKHIFHQTCIDNTWKHNMNHCPLCRQLINRSFLTYKEIQTTFIKDVLDKYKLHRTYRLDKVQSLGCPTRGTYV